MCMIEQYVVLLYFLVTSCHIAVRIVIKVLKGNALSDRASCCGSSTCQDECLRFIKGVCSGPVTPDTCQRTICSDIGQPGCCSHASHAHMLKIVSIVVLLTSDI